MSRAGYKAEFSSRSTGQGLASLVAGGAEIPLNPA
jgi:hypothetical protein